MSARQPSHEITVRSVDPDDVPKLGAFIAALGPGLRPLRFFSAAHPARLERYWAAPDAAASDHHGVLAQASDGRIIGHAAYLRLYGPRAELALELDDGGDQATIAQRLLRSLAQVASEHGIRHFVASGPAGVNGLLAPFIDGAGSGTRCSSGSADGWSVLEFPTATR
jgi:hypothetical protein